MPDDRLRPPLSGWTLRYEGFDPATEGRREALCTLGNGVFATRGAAPEARADGVHYPGTYLAGCFNRLVSEVEGRCLEHESLVNAPNWLALRFRVEDGAWFAPAAAELLDYRQELDLRRGLLTRRLRFADARGRRTVVTQRRLVSMADPRLAALETTFEAEGWGGALEVRSGLDGRVANRLVRDERSLASRHLGAVSTGAVDAETVRLETETVQSRIRIVEAARTRVFGAEVGGSLIEEPGLVEQALAVELAPGEPMIVEKVVALANSRDVGISEPGLAAAEAVGPPPASSGWRTPTRRRGPGCGIVSRSSWGRSTRATTVRRWRGCYACTPSTCCRPPPPTPSITMPACPHAACTARATAAISSGTRG